MVREARTVRCAAAVILLLLAAPVSFGADRSAAGPSRRPRAKPGAHDSARPRSRGESKVGEARLDTVKIVGTAERPAILFFLPRAKFRLLPLRPEPDARERLLRDDRLPGEPPGR